MKKTVGFFLLFVLSAVSAVPVSAEEEWRLVIDDAGIQVHKRMHPNFNMREYRVTSVFNYDIPAIMAVLNDISVAPQWFPLTLHAEIIEGDPEGPKTVVNISDFPWPCKDRYVVFRVVPSPDREGNIVIDFHSVAPMDRIEEKLAHNNVQIEFVEGQWTLEKVDAAHTLVTYRICADVGGSLPAWVVDVFLQELPYKMMKSLKEFVRKPCYQ